MVAQQPHQRFQLAQFVLAGQRLRLEGGLAAGRDRLQVLVEEIVAHRVAVARHLRLFGFLGLARQGVPVHHPGRRRRTGGFLLGRGGGVRGRPQSDQPLAEDIGLLGRHRPCHPGVALVAQPARHLFAALGLAQQARQQGIGMLAEFIRAQPAVAVEPPRRHHDDDARGGREVVGQRRQHQLHAQRLEARMAVGHDRHAQLVGQEAVGHEAQVGAGQLGRAQHHQPVAGAQRLAQPRQVAGLVFEGVAEVVDIDARRRFGAGPGAQGQPVPGAPARGQRDGQGQRRRQRMLPKGACEHEEPGRRGARIGVKEKIVSGCYPAPMTETSAQTRGCPRIPLFATGGPAPPAGCPAENAIASLSGGVLDFQD
ncbi:Uncharacterised protein [Achromobacter sp. 2789STDY5608615]|nr:Uncharacterised protein [Achromobacter sp. 2789STDY5608615]